MPEPGNEPLFESEYAEFGTCCLCGGGFDRWGNNPEPLASFPKRCCDDCNWMKVIPARLGRRE